MAASEIAGRHPFPDPYLIDGGRAITDLHSPTRSGAYSPMLMLYGLTHRPPVRRRTRHNQEHRRAETQQRQRRPELDEKVAAPSSSATRPEGPRWLDDGPAAKLAVGIEAVPSWGRNPSVRAHTGNGRSLGNLHQRRDSACFHCCLRRINSVWIEYWILTRTGVIVESIQSARDDARSPCMLLPFSKTASMFRKSNCRTQCRREPKSS